MDDLSPYEFDQSPKGWRLLDKEGKYLEAAKAIEAYILSHKVEIKNQNRVSIETMYFHVGQEYAMAGEKYYNLAIQNFQKAYKGELGWDAYVEGTIAFLKKDAKALRASVEKLTSIATASSSHEPNSKLLGRFLGAIESGKTYSEIYDSN